MTTPKKILVLTASAGFGHQAAADAVAAALSERYGNGCELHVINPLEDARTPAILRRAQSDYDRVVRELPELYRIGYQASDASLPVGLLEQALIVMLHATMRDLVQRWEPDAIISTYPLYQAPLASYFALSGHYIPLLSVITDLVTVHSAWYNDEVDLLLVPTREVEQRAIEHGLATSQIELTGIPVDPGLARSVDRGPLRARLGWPENRVVALLVGGRRVQKIEPVADVLNHSGLPLALALVAGGDAELAARWAATDWHQPAFQLGFVQNMVELLQAADLIICKAGGLIVSEALAAGLPLLMVEALPGQEVGNAEYVANGGAGQLAVSPVEALSAVCHWLEDEGAGLAQAAARSRALGRPDAASRAAELSWQAALRGPEERPHRFLDQVPFLRELLAGTHNLQR